VLPLKGKALSGWGTFIGAMIAFAVLTGIAVLIGEWLNANLPANLIEKIAAAGFVVSGILMWFDLI
ncbi:MAG: TMEM165/GDT1 family protein, partial [FCB group bacterium]|nr:TMEM165/GDT1 family protein [FCB group bacterium]